MKQSYREDRHNPPEKPGPENGLVVRRNKWAP